MYLICWQENEAVKAVARIEEFNTQLSSAKKAIDDMYKEGAEKGQVIFVSIIPTA
jgi:hypothetical protein